MAATKGLTKTGKWKLWGYKRSTARRRSPADQAYLTHKELARSTIRSRVDYYATTYGFTIKRISIKNPRRSWGSCSALGNLNFSYKLHFLPKCMCDYIIVHELCHLRELNHGAGFWREVEAIMPDYKLRMRELRQFEYTHGTSLQALSKLRTLHDASCSVCLQQSAPVKEICIQVVVTDRTTSSVAMEAVFGGR